MSFTPNSAALVTGLYDGRYDIAIATMDNFIAYQEGQGEAKLAGEPDFAVVMGGDGGFLSVAGGPGIKSFADLKGKTLSVDAMTTGLAFVLRELVARSGLSESDVTYVRAGGTPLRPHVREGKLVALAVSTGKRSSVLPNVPTIAESGLPGFDYNLWVGMFAPAGTPADVVDKINKDVLRSLRTPDAKERLTALGAEAMPMTPAEFTRFVHGEIEDSGKVIKAAGIKVQ